MSIIYWHTKENLQQEKWVHIEIYNKWKEVRGEVKYGWKTIGWIRLGQRILLPADMNWNQMLK